MKWSISKAKQFQRCQRQWYYKEIVGRHSAPTGSFRREVYLLGLLKSISQWRGDIVDKVLTMSFLTWHKHRVRLDPDKIIANARRHFDSQLAVAKDHHLHKPGLTPSKWSDFVVFRCMEYEGAIAQNELDVAWQEIEQAIRNLFEMRSIAEAMKDAEVLVAQRSLQFRHSGMNVMAVPDLVVFAKERPPVIIDWKVHAFGVQEAWLQLGIYALALSRAKPHKDFPRDYSSWKPIEVKLLEVQLLKQDLREYQLSTTDVVRLENHITTTSHEMLAAVGTLRPKYEDLIPEDFSVTSYPTTCEQCSYKRICWEEGA
ncbi:MAG: PD-(D/E)XK nuclease family protein [Gemmatimonadota bacterium]|nr:PD-(D/E)XK nuclease family protein [Gemmatimonadota bacterium]